MEIVLLAVTVVSLVVALVMSVTAWRLAREEKQRSVARIAALSVSAFAHREPQGGGDPEAFRQHTEAVPAKAPWAPAPRPQVHARSEPEPVDEIWHPSGFLGTAAPRGNGRAPLSADLSAVALAEVEALGGGGGRQHSLAIAAAVLFVGLAMGLVWMMSGPRGTTAAAVGPNLPLELVSLRHDRQNAQLAVSGLVRNPVTGRPVERLSAVVFLFDQQGTFVTSATSPVDFMKLGIGDESPFVVALDAPPTVARYRVSFRTDEGVVPHIDRRGAAPIAPGSEQPVSVTLK